MLRVWSEHLDYARAAQRSTLDLLARGPLHPIFAVHADADLDALAHLLGEVRGAGLEVGIWPLLRDDQGYWPCEQNATAYFERVDTILTHLELHGIAPDLLAVDLEPPLHQVESLREGWLSPAHLVGQLRHNLDRERFVSSARQFEHYRNLLQASHPTMRTLAVTLPMAAHDLRGEPCSPRKSCAAIGECLWQDLFEAPWSVVGWDRLGIMAYGSMVAGYSRGGLDHAEARGIHARLARRMIRHLGSERAHVSLGVTGIGKLGDEPAYTRPEQLALDVSAMRAEGVEDIAIFCLEGLVGREDAGQWVDAIRDAPPIPQRLGWRGQIVRVGARGARQWLRRYRKKDV